MLARNIIFRYKHQSIDRHTLQTSCSDLVLCLCRTGHRIVWISDCDVIARPNVIVCLMVRTARLMSFAVRNTCFYPIRSPVSTTRQRVQTTITTYIHIREDVTSCARKLVGKPFIIHGMIISECSAGLTLPWCQWFQVLLTWASTREPRRSWGTWNVAPLYPKGIHYFDLLKIVLNVSMANPLLGGIYMEN